ncbi:DUF350 domain-containing protein [Candidatus Gracilibacteria bacterium]|nr:MAG: DUF350 domain-containing protein [Candidatus Gracilibacteria bacterium]
MELEVFIKGVIGTILYSFIGIFIMVLFVIIIDKTTKFSIQKEIVEDENVALGVMLGCFFIAVAIIIAAAIV